MEHLEIFGLDSEEFEFPRLHRLEHLEFECYYEDEALPNLSVTSFPSLNTLPIKLVQGELENFWNVFHPDMRPLPQIKKLRLKCGRFVTNLTENLQVLMLVQLGSLFPNVTELEFVSKKRFSFGEW